MKKLIAMMILCGVTMTSAFADSVVYAKARGKTGGEVVLMKMGGQCPTGQMMMFAKAKGKKGHVIEGCWTPYKDGYIIVYYNDGDIRTYPNNKFTVMDD